MPSTASEGSLPGSPLSTLDKLFSVAWPGAVYSTPITAHDQTIITASEVTIAMGMGFGSGTGPTPTTEEHTAGEGAPSGKSSGSGEGGGGGGRSTARPVAVINVSPAGVRIQPIIDVSRLALTATTTLGALLMLRAVRRLRAKA
jgi:uncharacterized spore protein YtfJ